MDKKIIITKRLYKFEIKKKFQYVKHYKVKEKTRFEKLGITIGNIFRGKPSEKEKTKKTSAEAKSGVSKTKIIAGALLFALLILFLGWTYITAQIAKETNELIRAPEKPNFDIFVNEKGIMPAGDRGSETSVGYVRMAMTLNGVERYNLSMTTYNNALPTEVFVLQSEREQAEGYDDFLFSLKKELGKHKIILNEIDFEKLETLPGGSLVIVPSGIVPEELLGINSKVDINKLISRDVVLLYIGQKFDRMIDKTGASKSAPQGASGLPITFDEQRRPESTDGFTLYQPLYQARGSGSGIENSVIYGSVSVIKRGNGALILVPETIDGGWRNDAGQSAPADAGKDIARIILETKWAETSGNARIYSNAITNESKQKLDFFTNSFTSNVKSIKLEFTAYGKNNISLSQTKIIPIKKDLRGGVYVSGGSTVIPREVSGELTRLTVFLSENTSERKQLFLKITKNGEEAIERQSLGIQSLLNDLPTNSPIDLDNGEYIASVVDEEENIYAQGYLKVAFIEITYTPEKGPYYFEIERDGKSIAMKKINVTVDNKYGPYIFENTHSVSVDPTKDASGDLSPGEHIFTFRIGNIKKDIKIIKQKQSNIFTEPLFLITIVLAVGITGIGLFLARQEKVSYQIDVPDFPPIAKINVPLTKEVILNIFDKVNEDYKWNYSPLTTAEIRNGFKKMIYQGKPIYVTDYNVEYILNQLETKGYVKEHLDYYGPIKWEEKAKQSLKFLSLFRKIRDICVSNAVPFTQFEESKECDSEITAVGQRMFVHIYEKNRDLTQLVKRILSTIKDGMTIIIFKNDFAEREFQSYLASSSKALLTLKLEVEGGSVALFTLDEFEAKIKELKGV